MMMCSYPCTLQDINCSVNKPRPWTKYNDQIHDLRTPPLKLQPLMKKMRESLLQVPQYVKKNSLKLVDVFVDSTFQFVDQPLLPSQSNFAPVEEAGEAILINDIEGCIPGDFPEGVYVINGPNPLFGGHKSTVSIFGKSSRTWMEGEGMLHGLYFKKRNFGGWNISYNKKYIRSDTFNSETKRNKPALLPAIEGDPVAVLLGSLLNWVRFGTVDKCHSNTNIIEHAGRYYATAENHAPQEIDITTLKTIGKWHLDPIWNRPFTSHPKRIVSTRDLVTYGITGTKPYFLVGLISADGEKILHKVDVKLNRCTLCHEIGVTERYIVILDFPLTMDITRPIKGAPLMKFDNKAYARIGIMPHYGNADSIKWFDVETCSVLHVFNCFENEDEVIVRACRARGSIVPGPDFGMNKFEWFSRGFRKRILAEESENDSLDGLLFTRAYEWRLNLVSGEVQKRYLTGTEFSMEMPIINEQFTGLKNKFGYAQVADSRESSSSGMPKYGGLAKLYFEETAHVEQCPENEQTKELIKVEHHKFPERTFCSGAAFILKTGAVEEDDGWIITFVHNEDSNLSQAFIIDAKRFTHPPVAKILLPVRVPYGFHGGFMPTLVDKLR